MYESTLSHNALYIYKLPLESKEVIYTDKLTFATSRDSQSAHLDIMANQMLETAADGKQVRDFFYSSSFIVKAVMWL